jgi:solute carrier family 25 phosphate transporter 23/24/25/41
VNVLRIAPYSAVQFSAYETIKGMLVGSEGREIDTPRRLLAGSLAGIASVISTYPLDLVRSRLSIEVGRHQAQETVPLADAVSCLQCASIGAVTAKHGRGTSIIAMTVKVYREEGGMRGLYRGLTPTAAGVGAPQSPRSLSLRPLAHALVAQLLTSL